MADLITVIIICVIIGSAIIYIVNSKKKGKKCIGCPHSDSCSLCKCKDI